MRRADGIAVGRLGSVDVVVDNAIICHEDSAVDTDDKTCVALVATNLTEVFLMDRQAARWVLGGNRLPAGLDRGRHHHRIQRLRVPAYVLSTSSRSYNSPKRGSERARSCW